MIIMALLNEECMYNSSFVYFKLDKYVDLLLCEMLKQIAHAMYLVEVSIEHADKLKTIDRLELKTGQWICNESSICLRPLGITIVQ